MRIVECKGYELEKEKPNTSEDFFNRSEVTYINEEGQTKTLHVLYVRFFEEQLASITPFEQDPIITSGQIPIYFRDIVALICLLRNRELQSKRKVYINEQEDFNKYFEGLDFDKLPALLTELNLKQSVEIRSPFFMG
ncbi:hypothetical protein EJF36_11755 [Bacillus sp. HMF5848]|uniref:hypothetical protein n=1 Tax=Bacillus sp. HMF5848 TaxID=2495421 RepID=UPI000F77E2B5|nr:hypothetical protein [Bacillus sp. HMF5848]RSK27502.1 hypothetical protein EJF36_11755 [Bacillus sp. HMF5848]